MAVTKVTDTRSLRVGDTIRFYSRMKTGTQCHEAVISTTDEHGFTYRPTPQGPQWCGHGFHPHFVPGCKPFGWQTVLLLTHDKKGD